MPEESINEKKKKKTSSQNYIKNKVKFKSILIKLNCWLFKKKSIELKVSLVDLIWIKVILEIWGIIFAGEHFKIRK